MNYAEFQQLQQTVRLTTQDVARLQQLEPILKPCFQPLIELFYTQLSEDPHARHILDNAQLLPKLKQSLHQWLTELFLGPYDRAYFEKRSRIGEAHVRIHLPQRFMLSGMGIIRDYLAQQILTQCAEPVPSIQSLNKLLDLELALMLESFRESYVKRVREADRLLMHKHLNEVRHMAQIGQLAASLAHEIKNPLAGISGAIQIISKELEPSHPHREIMREILRQVDRLDSTVKDLLIYARPKPPELRPHDLGESVRNSLLLLGGDPTLNSLVIKCINLDHPIQAMIDPAQFEQVIANLILNAADACKSHGQLLIDGKSNHEYVTLKIKDNGVGMTPEVLARATEPFYTTKVKGTGLGLSICKRIIEAHQGRLSIDSAPGMGTSVEIILPAVPEAICQPQKVHA